MSDQLLEAPERVLSTMNPDGSRRWIRPKSAMGKWWKDIGATIIGFGDTTGSSNPVQVSRFYEYALSEGFTTDEVVVHFHDTRGWGIANSMTALTFGFTHFDTSIGAIGGQPKTGAAEYHHGFAGNTCTEDLVGMFEEMGVSTGIDIEMMIETGANDVMVLKGDRERLIPFVLVDVVRQIDLTNKRVVVDWKPDY